MSWVCSLVPLRCYVAYIFPLSTFVHLPSLFLRKSNNKNNKELLLLLFFFLLDVKHTQGSFFFSPFFFPLFTCCVDLPQRRFSTFSFLLSLLPCIFAFFFCLLRSTSLCFVTVKGKDALRLQSELFSLSLSPCTWLFSICARILLRTVRKEREYYTNFFFSFVCVAYVMKSAETGPKSSKWRRRRRVRERVILSLVNTVSCTCRHTVVPMPCMNFVVRKATLLCYVSFFFFLWVVYVLLHQLPCRSPLKTSWRFLPLFLIT